MEKQKRTGGTANSVDAGYWVIFHKCMFNMKNDNPIQISLILGRHVVGTKTCNHNQYLWSMLYGFGDGPVEVASFPHILDLPYYLQLAIS